MRPPVSPPANSESSQPQSKQSTPNTQKTVESDKQLPDSTEQPIKKDIIPPKPPFKFTHSKKWITIEAILLLIVIVLATSYSFYRNAYKPKSPPPPATPTPKVTQTPTPNPTVNWITYTSEIGQFKIKYPEDWDVIEYSNSYQSWLPCTTNVPVVIVHFTNSKGEGGLIIEATNDDECLKEVRDEYTGGTKLVDGLLYPNNFKFYDTTTIEGYDAKLSFSKTHPGVPTLQALITNIHEKNITKIYISYNYQLAELIKSHQDYKYPTNCPGVKENPLLGYFCKNGKILGEVKALETINEFNQILSTFMFTDNRKASEQKLPNGIVVECKTDSDCEAILSNNNCTLYCINNNPLNQQIIESLSKTCDATLWDPPLSLKCGCVENMCQLYE